jgi:hypothetical protein
LAAEELMRMAFLSSGENLSHRKSFVTPNAAFFSLFLTNISGKG